MHRLSVSTRLGSQLALVTTLAALAHACTPAKAAGPTPPVSVVLVHGALTDASVWNAVTKTLQGEGYTVLAPAMPLRGLASDAAYLESYLETVPSPVVLVAHS